MSKRAAGTLPVLDAAYSKQYVRHTSNSCNASCGNCEAARFVERFRVIQTETRGHPARKREAFS